MKKYLFLIPLMALCRFASATEVIPVVERGNMAEKIWMEKGLDVIFEKIRLDIKISGDDYAIFRKIYTQEILNDQFHFFQTAIKDDIFLVPDTKSNYEDWLNSRQLFYKKEIVFFLDNKDSIKSAFLKSYSNNFIDPEDDNCDTTGGCNNIGFNDSNFYYWTRYLGAACSDNSFGSSSCHKFEYGYLYPYDYSNRISIVTSGYDPLVGSILPRVCPGGLYSVQLEDFNLPYSHASKIEKIIKVTSDIGMFYYKYACVLQDPRSGHSDAERPYFRVRVLRLIDGCSDTSHEIECARYVVVANPNNPELRQNFTLVPNTTDYYYKNWTTVGIPLIDYIGQIIKIEFIVSDCSRGAHSGWVYLDGECLNLPEPTVSDCDSFLRVLDAPIGFSKYKWTGPGITCCNTSKSTVVDKSGEYQLKAITVSGCIQNYTINVDSCIRPLDSNCTITSLELDTTECNDSSNYHDLTGTLTFPFAPSKGVLVISNGSLTQLYNLPLVSPFNFTIRNLMSDGKRHTVTAKFYNSDFISPLYLSCEYSANYESPDPCNVPTIPCLNCITSFNPEPGRYIVGAWVKQLGALPDIETYSKPFIQIKFSSAGGTITLSKMYASGEIIDGWQRVFSEFSIPLNATDISIDLGTDSGMALIDDIRIHPANGSFVSYVYDPVSLKLVATLDDNNYATIYEYDNEGTLLRVKKETERGIMTIKESRENSPKR